MNIEGFVYRLSHDCHLDIDRDVSTAYCRSSSGNSVVLLSTTICTNMVVSDFVLQSITKDRDIKQNALIFKKIVLTHCMKNA